MMTIFREAPPLPQTPTAAADNRICVARGEFVPQNTTNKPSIKEESNRVHPLDNPNWKAVGQPIEQ